MRNVLMPIKRDSPTLLISNYAKRRAVQVFQNIRKLKSHRNICSQKCCHHTFATSNESRVNYDSKLKYSKATVLGEKLHKYGWATKSIKCKDKNLLCEYNISNC